MQDEDQARKTGTIQGTFFCLLINIDLLRPRGEIHLLKISMVYSEVCQSCPTLCDPVDCSPPGSSVRGILQARILEWVPAPGDLPNPGIEPRFPAMQAGMLSFNL